MNRRRFLKLGMGTALSSPLLAAVRREKFDAAGRCVGEGGGGWAGARRVAVCPPRQGAVRPGVRRGQIPGRPLPAGLDHKDDDRRGPS